MIELITASAGSGKTFTLAKKYIEILLKAYLENHGDTHEFEHVLAVTFTNKATAEMKDRILQELYILSQDPTLSDYYEDYCKDYGNETVSANTCKEILQTILHNYSRFSISTIDTFFQNVLRHFAREIGSFDSYRIELDRDAMVSEAADNLLSGISSPGDPVYKIVGALIKEKIGDGRKYNPKQELTDIAKELMGGEFIRALEGLGTGKGSAHEDLMREIKEGAKQFSDRVECLENVLKACREDAKRDSVKFAGDLLNAIDAYNVQANNVKKNVRDGIAKYYNNSNAPFSDPCLAALNGDESKLFNNKARDKEQFLSENGPLMEGLYGNYTKKNRTAELLKSIPHLKFAVSVFKAFAEVTDSANVKCLDDTTRILSEIIAGSDAPFIYEKIGTRFDHYLLDEFQDTSHIQWENFKPLLTDANSKGGHNLVVGDVKQSIYRFRNSDYTILDSAVPSDFAGQIKNTPLNNNFRSGKNIVEFNNDLFAGLAQSVDDKLAEQTGGSCNLLKDIYLLKKPNGTYVQPATVGQIVKKPFDGYVHYERICGENKDDLAGKIYSQIVTVVEGLCDQGVKKKDILILVRGKEEGSHIAEDLLREGIGVYSDDSLFISSNAMARRLLAVLRYMDNQKDEISGAIVEELGNDILGEEGTIFHSTLVDLCEKVIAKLKALYNSTPEGEEEFAGSIPYLSSLVDLAGEYETNYGNSLHNFLDYYDRKEAKIASSASDETVRIMTIHKSKGLAGEFVIVPFINKFILFNTQHNRKWSGCDAVPLPAESHDFPYYASLVKGDDSAFHSAYIEEYKQRSVDAMNLLYVAFTRAQHGLYILEGHNQAYSAELLSRVATDYLAAKNNDHIVRNDEEGMVYELGDLAATIADYSAPEVVSNPKKAGLLEKLNHMDPIPGDYFVSASRAAVRNSVKANEFFDGLSEDGEIYVSDSKLKGILQHAILSAVHTADDVDSAVEGKWQEGILEGTKEDAKAYLKARINSVAEYGWFAPDATVATEEGMLVKTRELQKNGNQLETPVASRILPDGKIEYIVSRRPDRIVVHPNGDVDIVDYKFTGAAKSNLAKYRQQVAAYCNYYRSLPGCGNKNVYGYIWYVNAERDAVVNIEKQR